MENINTYFQDLIFYKTNDYFENYIIYVAKVSSPFETMYGNDYILAFVPQHVAILRECSINNLQWKNIQTRTLKNGYDIKKQKWNVPRGVQNILFELVERGKGQTTYKYGPLEMILLNDPKKKSEIQYPARMNLLAALSTFRCVISTNNNVTENNNFNSSFELL